MKKIITFFLISFIGFNIAYSQWQQLNGISPVWVKSLASNGNNIFAGNFILIGDEISDNGLGAWVSTNNGLNWNVTSLNIAPSNLHFRNSRLFACAGGLFYTDNNGVNWIPVMPSTPMKVISSNSTTVFCGGTNALYSSTNNGINWSTCLNSQTSVLLVKNNYIFSGDATLLRISSNNGANWNQLSVDGKVIYSLATNGFDIFAGTNSGLYKSTNNGVNWLSTSLSGNLWITSILAFDSIVIASALNGFGIYKSNNYGLNWIQRNEGLNTGVNFDVLHINNNYIYGGGPSGLWRRNLQEVLSVKPVSEYIPDKFSLSQNYPNPFNPVTNIKFQIANNKYVTLKVFDILGKEIASLVNEKLKPGEYEVSFDGSNLSSGVYFYKLQSGDFTDTKKLVLLK